MAWTKEGRHLYSLIKQSLVVIGMGLTVSTIVGGVRGLPDPVPQDMAQACAAPEVLALTPQKIDADTAYQLVTGGQAVLIDCRSTAEFARGHVAGAISLPAEELRLGYMEQRHLASAPTVIAYCDAACARSNKVAQHIMEAGFADVRILEGGMEAWVERGYPAESGIPASELR